MAIKGDIGAIKLIWNYLEGMPTQKLETESKVNLSGLETNLKKIAEDGNK